MRLNEKRVSERIVIDMNTNITSGTIARTIILALALVNQLLSVTGHAVLPIEDAQIETLVSTLWTVAAAVVAWWKNNSVTTAAIEADAVMKDLKAGVSLEDNKGTIEMPSENKGEVLDDVEAKEVHK